MVHCRACGKEIHESARVCPQCGAPQTAASDSSDKRIVLWLIDFIMIIAGAFTDKTGRKLTQWT
jgi:hypothetical protein